MVPQISKRTTTDAENTAQQLRDDDERGARQRSPRARELSFIDVQLPFAGVDEDHSNVQRVPQPADDSTLSRP
jgi:hypothetical protein